MRPIDYLSPEKINKIIRLQNRMSSTFDREEIQRLHNEVMSIMGEAKLRYEIESEMLNAEKMMQLVRNMSLEELTRFHKQYIEFIDQAK